MRFLSLARASRWGAHLALVLLACGGLACGESGAQRERCAECGMFVDLAPRWMSGSAEGGPRYDTPKCMFRHDLAAAREGWITEYYSQARRDTAEVVFVVGSDVIGPMGADLVPIAGAERAAGFVRDHGGRVVALEEVDDALLRSLE